MRFGAFIPQGWRHDLVGIDRDEHWPTMQRIAGEIERLGFESVWVYDHFHPVPEPTQEPVYEAWTLMTALATTTSTARLGQMCTCNSYRPPSYLAKVAATIDVISSGRLEMGIGAGWYEHEYLGYGYPFPKASTRIGQLREGVEIMRRMWTEDEVHYEGEHYTLQGALCRPKPVQQPHIPLWIAGGGPKLTLNVAARYADATNFGYTLDQFVEKSEILADHCRAVGRDFDEITRSTNLNIAIGETEEDVADYFAWYREHFEPVVGSNRLDRMVRGNYLGGGGMAGTPDQMVEQLREWEAAGMTYAIVYFQEAAYDTRRMELFAREVMPALA
jgi:F420-dependent oxidoreductase-like protein